MSKVIEVALWHVRALECGDNMDLVAVLELQTDSGVLSIINFHNPNKTLNIAASEYMMPQNGLYVLLGDSNLHSPLWGGGGGGDGVEACPEGKYLEFWTKSGHMWCLAGPQRS